MSRLLAGLPIAFAITVALFLFMRYMVLVEYREQQEQQGTTVIVTRPERDETLNTRDRSKPDRPEQADAPPPPPMQVPDAKPGQIDSITVDIGDMRNDLDLGKIAAAVDTNAIPIFCQPTLSAQEVGKGGWIIISFDITVKGTVENPVVIDGSPPGKYDRIMLREVKKCKFKAKTKDGKYVPQYNKQYMFSLRPPQ